MMVSEAMRVSGREIVSLKRRLIISQASSLVSLNLFINQILHLMVSLDNDLLLKGGERHDNVGSISSDTKFLTVVSLMVNRHLDLTAHHHHHHRGILAYSQDYSKRVLADTCACPEHKGLSICFSENYLNESFQ